MGEPRDLRGETVRDIGYLAWSDDESVLEKMSGSRWQNAVKDEHSRWSDAIREIPHRREYEKELRVASEALQQIRFEPGWRPITMDGAADAPEPLRAHFCTFDVSGSGGSRDIPTHIWLVRDSHNGGEQYDLSCWERSGNKAWTCIWTKKNVGPTIGLHEGRCYYIVARRIHWLSEVRSCDALTGNDDISVLKSDSDRENMEIISVDDTLFVRKEDSGRSALWSIVGDGNTRIIVGPTPKGYQVPFGKGVYAIRDDEDDYYKYIGMRSPSAATATERPLWGSHRRSILVTRIHGGGIKIYVRGKVICEYGIASYTVNRIMKQGLSAEILVQTPADGIYIYRITEDGNYTRRSYGTGGYKRHAKMMTAVSADGTSIPYWIVRSSSTRALKGLLVYGYGSYGVATFNGRVESQWGPLLNRGWGIIYAMIRGGGDSTDRWADAARLTGRVRGIEDFEAVIRSARRVLDVPAERTVIAGRSAGGLLVGAAIARSPGGDLFRHVFAEVPYVDVLRTTTNPGLPLTTVEYNEFGWPEKRVEDFAALVKIAPIESLPACGGGVPMISVLCRSGINDTQVLAYEPMKWIRRLRGASEASGAEYGRPKLLALKEGEGHFYSMRTAKAARADDLALLSAWVDENKNLRYEYKNKMADRKTRKERKSRKNLAGGKRRKAATRKAARKGRKATRKH
jgi:hypothetical protein